MQHQVCSGRPKVIREPSRLRRAGPTHRASARGPHHGMATSSFKLLQKRVVLNALVRVARQSAPESDDAVAESAFRTTHSTTTRRGHDRLTLTGLNFLSHPEC